MLVEKCPIRISAPHIVHILVVEEETNSNDPPLHAQTCGQPLFWKCPVFQAAAATDKADSVSLAQVDKDKTFELLRYFEYI